MGLPRVRILKCFYRTYKELKLDNVVDRHLVDTCFYRTYKELKLLLFPPDDINKKVFIVPIRN